jgi:organic hydroperoxide reductase OsmC/OhrA
MSTQALAAAIQRVEATLQRRPEMGLHDDAPATARWDGGTRVVARHANGFEARTDMPAEFGGSGEPASVTPGWLFRAGLASCAATTIAMTAAAQGIELTALEVAVTSRSDTRGLLGMADARGESVDARPFDVQMQVRIGGRDTDPARLRALVGQGCRCSPIPNAVQSAVPVELRIEVDER